MNLSRRRALGVFLLGILPFALHAEDDIRVRVNNFAPLYFLENQQWLGLDIELSTAIVKEAGFSIKYMEIPWSRAMMDLRNGDVDMILNFSRTPEREDFSHFIGPIRIAQRALVVRKENVGLKISNLDELAEASRRTGILFGVLQRIRNDEAFDNRIANDPVFARQFESVARSELLPKKVAHKHNLGFFQDVDYVIYHLKTDPDFQELALHSFRFPPEPIYYGVSKKLDPTKVKELEAAFHRLEANGVLTKIRNKWRQ